MIDTINMREWIDRDAALHALGIKPQTLYAYVSRGRIGMCPDPGDPRRSLYRADDVAALRARHIRGRKLADIAAGALAWGEPSLATSISTVHQGTLLYRGVGAVDWARAATLEDTAALLWQGDREIRFPAPRVRPREPFSALAALAASGRATLGLGGNGLRGDAATAIGHLAASLGAARGDAPVHRRLAEAWSLGESEGERIRLALILLAEHELNASTFAVRVAASTGASVAAGLLAGLCALSGPRHGGAGMALAALMGDARRCGAGEAVAAWLARGRALPGFGHPLYPAGDPRARALLAELAPDETARALQEAAFAETGDLPNVDFALACLAEALRLPGDAPLSLFLLGRSVGWSAHFIEQSAEGGLIRPRARYRGPGPRSGPAGP
ncbi:citrate synthase [Methylobacterium sp. WSM2598]|uniref:citrate synthase n=1 Tax=Methylobacterium sp. WSM2598 TaxID=398261 RepID=UPI000379B4E1|nr:citrate synthase [Methylobacterium sp. WSM2598]